MNYKKLKIKVCPECGGTGKVFRVWNLKEWKEDCPDCSGTGNKQIKLTIPIRR